MTTIETVKKQLLRFLYPQQQDAFFKLIDNDGGVIFWKVGAGKTRIALISLYYILRGFAPAPKNFKRAIAIVCRRTAFDDWRNEIATLQFNWDVQEIENVDATKALKSDTFILVSDGKLISQITVATLQRLVRFQQMKGLIIDEGYLFANPKALRHQAVCTISRRVPTVLLSGSIMSRRDLAQVYGQVTAAGKGTLIAQNLTRFRSIYQTGIQGAFFAYYPKPGAYKALMEKVAPFTHIYFPHEKEGTIKEAIIKVAPNSRQLNYFKELKDTFAIEGVVEFNSAATLVIKTQQVSNGWLKGEEGDVIEFPSTKIDRLVALVEEILASGQRCVVWCAFRYDIDRLLPLLSTRSCNVATFRSGENFDTVGWHEHMYQVCLATEASGSSVNHFAQVPYGIYFSQDWKWMSLNQSKGRHTRKSSKHSTTYFYYMHTDKSMDARVHYTVKISGASEKSFIKTLDVNQWLKDV